MTNDQIDALITAEDLGFDTPKENDNEPQVAELSALAESDDLATFNRYDNPGTGDFLSVSMKLLGGTILAVLILLLLKR